MATGISQGLITPTYTPMGIGGGGIASSLGQTNAPQGYSPAVITSSAATNDLNNIQTQHADIVSRIDEQAKINAERKAAAEAAAKDNAAKEAADKITADKIALDKKNQEMKAAVVFGNTTPSKNLVGTTPTAEDKNPIRSEMPHETNPDWKQITRADGSIETISKSTGLPVPINEVRSETARVQLEKTNQDFIDKGNSVSQLITNISNGVVPLNAAEQAQVAGLQQSFQQLIDQQVLENKNAVGMANTRGFQKGAAEYDPTFQVKTIGSIVTAGINKVSDLNIKMASAVAALTESFKDKNINRIKESWNVYKETAEKRQKTLQDTVDSVQKQIKDAQEEADKKRDYDLNVLKFQETKDMNAFDKAYKEEQQRIDRIKSGIDVTNGLTTDIPSTQMSGTGTPDPVSQKTTYDAIVQKYGPMTAISIKGLASYDRLPTDWSVRPLNGKGLSRADAVALAQQLDPTYSETAAPARQAYIKSLQQGTIYQAVISANKGINHLIAFADDVSKLGNIYPVSSINKASQIAGMPFSKILQQYVPQAKTEATGIASELAKFFKGTGTSDVTTINEWAKSLDIGANPTMLKGTVQGAINLLAGQLDVMMQSYRATMGKDPEGSILQPETAAKLSELKNQGYQVDIPGVHYTNKDAFLKYDPDASEKMSAALKTLNDAGLPITPENILQMAQS